MATPDPALHWAQLRRLFEDGLRLPTSEREAWLTAQAPPALRAELRALLAQAEGETRWPHPAALLDEGEPAELRLGPWALVERIGQGGMGEVWRARRADGHFDAEVALKLLRVGWGGADLVRRFAQEQQALAQMQHPHIARLLDAGVSPQQRPYFVMELVRGQPIDAAATGLNERARLALFLQLADAVAHAHRKLVVHRDIKPSNVLVDAEGQVKLLDFGIAKMLDPLLGDSAETQLGQRPYTPAYAAPEQVRGEPVSTATDVYALGVLLYRLLTGLAPYGREAPTGAEQSQAVLNEAPAATTLTRDLDQVLAKALRKPVDERYASVEALADDLRRYLGGYPVRARPPGRLEAAWKFVRRQPLASGLTALLLASVLVGSGAAAWQARKAEQRLASIKQITRDAVFRFGDAVTYVPGGMAIKAELLQQMTVTLDGLTALSADDAELRASAAMAYAKLADIEFNDTSASLARGEQGRAHAARALELASGAIEQRLADADFVIWYIRAVESAARSERSQGHVDAALATLQPVLALLERAVAAVQLPEVGEDRRSLQVEHARALHLRAQFYFLPRLAHLNRPRDALVDLAQARRELLALEAERHHAEILYVLGSVDGAEALARAELGELPAAVQLARQALDRRETVVRELPEDIEYRDALITEAINLGRLLLRAGDPAAALVATTRGWEMNEALQREHASDPANNWARRRANLANHQARALLAQGQQTQAQAVLALGLAASPQPEERTTLLGLQGQAAGRH